jgi:predicted transcriptional regulator
MNAQSDIIGCMAKKQTRPTGLGETIRDAIERSGLSLAEVARRAELPYSGLYRFAIYGGDLTLDSATRICAVLGLELRPTGRKGAK